MTAPKKVWIAPLYDEPYIRADAPELVAMVEALEAFQSYGCPVCHGDCASANPPVFACPMRLAYESLTGWKALHNDP